VILVVNVDFLTQARQPVRLLRKCRQRIRQSRLRNNLKKLFLSFFYLLIALLPGNVAQAHAADMYFHLHTIRLHQDGIVVIWEIAPGSMLAEFIYYEADENQDGTVSDEEAIHWITPRLAGFYAALDDQTVDLQVNEVAWPEAINNFVAGEERIKVTLWGDWPGPLEESNDLRINNFFQELEINSQNSLFSSTGLLSVNWFSLEGMDGIWFDTPQQDQGILMTTFSQLEDGNQLDQSQLNYWESGTPDMPAIVQVLGLKDTAEQAMEQAEGRQGLAAVLEGMVRTPQITPIFALTAFSLALVLGGLHALGPGHGKTLVAAYLVGAQGKPYHAVALGSIVTITHTGSVFALGLLTILMSRYIIPTDLFPVLELISGLLIIGLGIALLLPRIKAVFDERRRRQIEHEQSKSAQPVDREGGRRIILNQSIKERGPAHSHEPSTRGYIPTSATIGDPLASISWRSLLALGVSGGLVPCPDAIAILLIAMAINRLVFGLSLIVFFSMGLALILIVIGLMIVQGKQLFSRLQWFDRVSYWMPIFSSVVVIGLGAGVLLSSMSKMPRIEAGVAEDLQIPPTVFDINAASILYTAQDSEQRKQLFRVGVSGEDPEQLTDEPNNVWEYALSPNGKTVVYSALSPDGRANFKEIDLESGEQGVLLECGRVQCWDPVWAPDGGSLLYSHLDMNSSQSLMGFPSIWWFDFDSRETGPLFQDDQQPGYSPSYSPEGDTFKLFIRVPNGTAIF
jgi:ABC-type nickel/cobalt efflux system permease component RcnA